MTGCSMKGCVNRSEDGFSMKRFPINAHQRKLWAEKCNGANWMPSINSCICEVHFDSNQWEVNRVDGKSKLKTSAIPITPEISSDKNIIQSMKTPSKCSSTLQTQNILQSKEACEEKCFSTINTTASPVKRIFLDHSYTRSSDTLTTIPNSSQINYSSTPTKLKLYKILPEQNPFQPIDHKPNITVTNIQVKPKKKIRDYTPHPQIKKDQLIKSLRQQLKLNQQNLFSKTYELENIVKSLQAFLTTDQIQALRLKSKNGYRWSDDTIEKALKIKTACRSSGYKVLLNLNYPLPSLRTLHRKLLNP